MRNVFLRVGAFYFCLFVFFYFQGGCTKKHFTALPRLGVYVKEGGPKDCSAEGLPLPDHANWRILKRENTSDFDKITKEMSCDFICKHGLFKINTESKRACEVPGPGKWVDEATQRDCSFAGQSEHFGDWKPNPDSGLSTDTCDFICRSGYVKKVSGDRTLKNCVPSSKSHYTDSENKKKPCGIAPDNGLGWLLNQVMLKELRTVGLTVMKSTSKLADFVVRVQSPVPI